MSAVARINVGKLSSSAISARSMTPMQIKKPRGVRRVAMRAASEEATESEFVTKFNETLSKTTKVVKEKWEETDNSEKPAAIAIVIGAVVAQVAIGATVDAVDHIPVLKQFFELVGIGFTGFTGYNLIVNPSERTKLKDAYDDFISKVVGK